MACVQRSSTESYLAFAIHPIVADADNAAAILSGLSTAYDAVVSEDASDVSPATLTLLQPSTLADWEQKQQAPEAQKKHAAFWASSLCAATTTLDLPRSVNRSKAGSGAVWSIPFQLPKNVWQRSHQVAANETTTPVAVLLAAFQVSSSPGTSTN